MNFNQSDSVKSTVFSDLDRALQQVLHGQRASQEQDRARMLRRRGLVLMALATGLLFAGFAVGVPASSAVNWVTIGLGCVTLLLGARMLDLAAKWDECCANEPSANLLTSALVQFSCSAIRSKFERRFVEGLALVECATFAAGISLTKYPGNKAADEAIWLGLAFAILLAGISKVCAARRDLRRETQGRSAVALPAVRAKPHLRLVQHRPPEDI